MPYHLAIAQCLDDFDIVSLSFLKCKHYFYFFCGMQKSAEAVHFLRFFMFSCAYFALGRVIF